MGGDVPTPELGMSRNPSTQYDIYSNSYGFMNILFSVNTSYSFTMTFTISSETINDKNKMIININV